MVKPNVNGAEVQSSLEPSEMDPCMEKQDKKTLDDKNFLLRFRNNVCDRWNLSHQVFYVIGALILLIVICVIVVIALAASWPHVPHSQQFPICKSPQCLRVASQVRAVMNSTVSPCSDLWSWACGGWLSQQPLPKDRSIWNQKQQLTKQGMTVIRDAITTLNLPLHVASVEWKLKHLYEACLNVDNVNTDEARPLLSIISELGGWYILRDWNKDDFDPKAILKQLHVKYGVTPYFKVTVESDPYVRGQSVIRISPSGLGLPDREYYYLDQEDRIQNAYKELIRDVVKYLSSTRNEAEKFGKDIFYYEKRIAEITPSYKYSKDPIKTCNHVKLSELKETAGTIPFYDILTEMFPEANINESTEVLVTSLEYLTSISQIIASTDRQTFNGYLMWTLVYKYLPYLSDKFTSAFHNFQAELLGAHEPLKRWEMCATLIQDFMSFAALVDDEIKNPINENSRGVINETYHSILNVVHKRLEKFRTMPDLYNHLKRKLLTISLQVGFPKEVKESAYIKDYYAKLRIIKTNLFESVKFGIEFKKKLEEKRLVKSSPDQAIVQQLCQHPREVTYLPSYNLIAIPKSLLIQPFFEEEYPRAVIYARLGVEIADAVLSAILPYNSFWTHDKKLLSPYHQTVNDSLKSISKARYCLYKYILNQNLTLLYDTADETALMVLKQISAVGIANEALISASSHREHIHQSGLEEYDDSPLFFLSYAQTQCSESTNQFQTYNNIVNFKLPQRSVLHILWSQLLTFSESLECSANKKDTCSDIF